jgi:L-ascorbate metabolism protein UlaG (beta-lactamase superfamily)
VLRPRVAVPIHWGTYAPAVLWAGLGTSFLARPPHDFVRAARRLAPDVQVRVLAPGESTGMEPA